MTEYLEGKKQHIVRTPVLCYAIVEWFLHRHVHCCCCLKALAHEQHYVFTDWRGVLHESLIQRCLSPCCVLAMSTTTTEWLLVSESKQFCQHRGGKGWWQVTPPADKKL